MPSVTLVVPTIRENCFRDFVDRWGKLDLFRHVTLVLMEDNPERTFDLESILGPHTHFKGLHYSWRDIESELGEDSWIIPRRSDTVRSYGYLKAWQCGTDYVMTLDDDCYPCGSADGLIYNGEQFVEEHVKALSGRTRWFNTLDQVKPRGVPFYNLGTNRRVMVNHGLWTNVLDYDAPTQLVAPQTEQFAFDSKLVPAGSYFPMCGMNVMWRREATVLMYHLLMGQMVGTDPASPGGAVPTLTRLPFDRFGDIWCGILMKRVLDLTGHNVSTGMPYIRHERASNPFTNLRKEANGLEVNERFWEHVDRFCLNVGARPDPEILPYVYGKLGQHVATYDEFPEHVDYFRRLGDAMRVWSGLFTGRSEP
jgi:hypothetical protein